MSTQPVARMASGMLCMIVAALGVAVLHRSVSDERAHRLPRP